MTLDIRHAFVCGLPDDPAADYTGEVKISHWNEALLATMASGYVLGRTSSGVGAVEEISISTLLSSVVPYTGASQPLNMNQQSITNAGNLGLVDGTTSGIGTLFLDNNRYRFLDGSENPATLDASILSLRDQNSPPITGSIGLTDNYYDFLDGGGNQALLRISGAAFWDVMSSSFYTLAVGSGGSSELEYKNEFGVYLPIYSGATWLSDSMSGPTVGIMDYYDGNFRFNDNGGNPVPIFHGSSYFYDALQGGHGSIILSDEAFEFYTAIGNLATLTGGIIYANQQLQGNFADGTSFVTDKNSSSVGVGISSPAARLHVYTPTATATYLKLGNSATSSLGTDGFDIGVSSTGVAEIRNREVTAMQFFCGNTNYMTLASNAPTLTLDSQGSNSANAGTIIFRTAGGSESFTQTFDASANVYTMTYGTVAALRINSNSTVLAKQGGTTNLSGVMTTAWSSNTTIGNVGIGEDDLRSFTTAGSTLNSNADAIFFDAVGLFAANANNKRVRVYFGGTLIFDTTALAFNGGNWWITGKINRTTTTTADIIVTWTSSNATLQFLQTYTAFSGNLLASNILKVTAEATADNDVTQRNFQVWWQPG